MVIFICDFCGRQYELKILEHSYRGAFGYEIKKSNQDIRDGKEPCGACEERIKKAQDDAKKETLKSIQEAKQERDKRSYGDGKYGS